MSLALTWHDLPAADDESRAERRLWRTGFLSLVVHGALLVALLPHLTDLRHAGEESDVQAPPLAVELASPRSAPRAERVPGEAAPAIPRAPAERRERPAPRPPIPPLMTMPREPLPDAWRVPAPVAEPLPDPRIAPRTEARPVAPTPEGDLSSYIAARRAARGEAPTGSSGPGRDPDAARRERAIAQNLASLNEPRPLLGNPRTGGGLFQITLKSYDFAEFRFFGWNSEIGRQAPQRIEVRKGDNPTIDLAIVRRMIALIRETQHGDFTWRSDRSGRDVTLSARPEDNGALETFLMNELFGPPVRQGPVGSG